MSLCVSGESSSFHHSPTQVLCQLQICHQGDSNSQKETVFFPHGITDLGGSYSGTSEI